MIASGELIDPESEATASLDLMPFVLPQYSRKRVNDAGDALVRSLTERWWKSQETMDEYYAALDVINNWRAGNVTLDIDGARYSKLVSKRPPL